MKLSIIISNRNDVVLLNITLRSAIEALVPFRNDGEIVVVDNSNKKQWEALPAVIPHGYRRSKKIRLYRQEEPCFTAARMEAVRQAKGEYIFCVDSHVLFGHDQLKDCVHFMDHHAPPEIGFGHPPLSWSHQGEVAKRWTLRVSDNGTAWGQWAEKGYRQHGKMFWKFMPWICRRDWYLNELQGYGSHARYYLGWGGAELLQQVKSLMLGYENWAIATRPTIHIGPFKNLAKDADNYRYRTYSASGQYPGVGVYTAFFVFLGEDGIIEAKKTENRLIEKHNMDLEKGWPLARAFGKDEHDSLKQRRKYTYHQLLAQKPWED